MAKLKHMYHHGLYPEVTTLYLDGNQFTAKIAPMISDNITTLYISNNVLGDEGAIALSTHLSLEFLDISDNHVSSEGIKALARGKLKFLEIDRVKTNQSSLMALAANKSLQGLFMANSNIDDNGVNALATSSSLQFLGLDKNPLTTRSLQNIVAMPNLVAVSLSDIAIGDAGAAILAKNQKFVSVLATKT